MFIKATYLVKKCFSALRSWNRAALDWCRRHEVAVILILIILVLGCLTAYSNDFRARKQLLLQWTIIVFAGIYFLKNPWLRLFLIWTLVRAVMGWNIYCISSVRALFSYIIFYQVLVNYIKKEHLVQLLNGICILALIQAFWMILQHCNVWIHIAPRGLVPADVVKVLWKGHILILKGDFSVCCTGFMSNTNMAASVLALSLPAFFRKQWYWGIPFVWGGLLIARTLGGIIPACFAMACLAWMKGGKDRILIILIGLCYFSLYLTKYEKIEQMMTGSMRFPMWKHMIKDVIPKRWVMGWGVGQFKILFPALQKYVFKTEPIAFREAHNEYLQLWIEQGIIGVTIAMGYLTAMLVKGIKLIRSKSYVSQLALIGLGMAMLNAGVNFLCQTNAIIIAIIYVVILEKKSLSLQRR